MDTDQRTDHEGSDGSADGSTRTPSDDYDSPWKDIIHSAFPEFMAFFSPMATQIPPLMATSNSPT